MEVSMIKPFYTRLAGVTFDDCQANIKQWGCPDIGTYALVREPNNPHDRNAVRVSLFGIHDMGYLPRNQAARLAPLMDDGRTFLAEYVHRNEYAPYENVGLTVRIVETTWQ